MSDPSVNIEATFGGKKVPAKVTVLTRLATEISIKCMVDNASVGDDFSYRDNGYLVTYKLSEVKYQNGILNGRAYLKGKTNIRALAVTKI